VNNYSNDISVDGAGNSWITGYLGGGSNTFGSFTLNGPGGYIVKYDSNGNAVFATKLGVNGALDLYGITHDFTGNSYATGYLQSSETIGSQTFNSNGSRDAVLIKLDASGVFQWLEQSWTFSSGYTYGNSVCCDQNNDVYLCGNFDNTTIIGGDTLSISSMSNMKDAFIAKYDPAGNALWAEQTDIQGNFGGQLDFFAITSRSSSIYVTGVFSDDLLLGSVLMPNNNTGMNTFIIEYDLNGNCVFGLPSTGQNPGAFGHGISTDPSGAIYIAGFDKAPVTFGTDVTTFYGGEDLFVARIGGNTKMSITEYNKNESVHLVNEFASSQIILLIEDANLLNEELVFSLYDLTGRIVLQTTVISNRQPIDLSTFTTGVYSWSVIGTKGKLNSGTLVR
jgi:hypothetical protein